MSMISFIQEAGERLFKRPPTTVAASKPAQASNAVKTEIDALNRTAAEAIRKYVASKGLAIGQLELAYDGATSTVTVSGTVPDQETREKVVICCGNVASVHRVNDRLTVAHAGDASEYYTVKHGDTLAAIARQFYGSAERYNVLFEANKPMLTDPDKIYPGQTLRIPRLS